MSIHEQIAALQKQIDEKPYNELNKDELRAYHEASTHLGNLLHTAIAELKASKNRSNKENALLSSYVYRSICNGFLDYNFMHYKYDAPINEDHDRDMDIGEYAKL